MPATAAQPAAPAGQAVQTPTTLSRSIAMDAVESAVDDAAAPSASPQEIWDNMRIALPKLDAGAQKSALACFPADFRLDFKAPCLFIASHSLGKCDLRFDEALHITMAALGGTLHESFVHVGDLQCTPSFH